MKIYKISYDSKWEKIETDQSASYEQRIHDKEAQEKELWDRIKNKIPWTVEQTTQQQDQGGIDAIITGLKGGRPSPKSSIQLKMRQSGDDVLLEVIRPWPPKDLNNPWTGRDLKTNVYLYYCVDTKGLLRIFAADMLKNTAKDLASQFIARNKNNPSIRSANFPQGEVKIVTDPSQQASYTLGKVDKLVVFIRPSVLKPTYTIQL